MSFGIVCRLVIVVQFSEIRIKNTKYPPKIPTKGRNSHQNHKQRRQNPYRNKNGNAPAHVPAISLYDGQGFVMVILAWGSFFFYMVPYSKPAKSPADLVQQLKQRGLAIADEARAGVTLTTSASSNTSLTSSLQTTTSR